MKTSLSFLILMVVTAICFSTQASLDEDPFLTKAIDGKSIQKVYARTSGGSISVQGISSGNTRVEVYVKPNNGIYKLSQEELRKRLDQDYELNISSTNNQLNAVAKQKDRNMNWKRQLSISFKIFIGTKVSTDLSTSGGRIELANLSGNHNFATSGGSLHLNELSGKINGKTSGGSITVLNSSDQIRLQTSGGSIKADNCKGDIILATSGGSLNLSNLEGKIDARTSGGSIHCDEIKGELSTQTSGGSLNLKQLSCSLNAATSGGSINISLVKLGRYVKVSNSAGNINLEVPGGQGLDLKLQALKIKVDNLNNFDGSKEDNEILGKLNGGGVPVEARTGSGRITLAFK